MVEFLQNYGLIGLFLGTFMSATIIPFSSEIFVTGALISGLNPLLVFIAAVAGNWLGGLTTYWMGRIGKWEWIEKWFKVKEESLLKQKAKIDKYGSLLAFCTWFPFVGDIFSIGLGFYKINFTKCAIFTLIGRSCRFGVWILLYVIFGESIINFFS